MSHTIAATVFVVEDDAETRNSFAALISSLDLPLEVFASGEDFLHVLDGQRPGCVLADFRLRGMDGVELHRRLTAAGCGLPVLLVSAYLSVRVAAGALQQGIFEVVEKPYRDDQLADAIRRALEHDRATREGKLYRLDVAHRLESLNPRQRCTLDWIIAGAPNKTIARRLGVSPRTVERIRSAILETMGSMSFVELSAALAEARIAGSQDSCLAVGHGPHPRQPLPPANAAATPAPGPVAPDERTWRLLCCDLHDGAAQYVSAALLRLQAVAARPGIPQDAQPLLREAAALLSVTLRDLRDVVAGRAPACFPGAEIVSSIQGLIEELAKASGLRIDFVEGLDGEDLGLRQTTAICRILQESLNNALRHSHSGRVRVALAKRPGTVRLEVRDWGVGFDPDTVTGEQRGLRGIRERAQLLGGSAAVESGPGQGTLVAVELPLQASSAVQA